MSHYVLPRCSFRETRVTVVSGHALSRPTCGSTSHRTSPSTADSTTLCGCMPSCQSNTPATSSQRFQTSRASRQPLTSFRKSLSRRGAWVTPAPRPKHPHAAVRCSMSAADTLVHPQVCSSICTAWRFTLFSHSPSPCRQLPPPTHSLCDVQK